MKPKIIKSEADYVSALAHLESLMDSLPGTPEEEELELFAVLIENYEDEHFPIDMPDPVEAIKFRMEQQGLTRKDLVQYIGSQSKVSEVLNGKRPLSISMIRALEKGLGIPAKILLQVPGENQARPDNELDFSDLSPSLSAEEEFSGELNLQVPEGLYWILVRNASREGVSLDAYIRKALESYADENKTANSVQKTYSRKYPGLSAVALQLMIANGLEAEANRSDELLFGQWLKQKIDEIDKTYSANEFEKSSLIIENMLACLGDSVSESPIIEGLIHAFGLEKMLIQSYVQNTAILQITAEKLHSQIDQMIGHVNTPHQKFNTEFSMNYVEATARPESTLADSLFQQTLEKNKMGGGK